MVGRAKEPRALIAASAAKLTKAESALLQIVLTPRLALSPPAEEAFDAGGGWPLVSDLDPAARSAAEALLDAGWLEVRHDGGLLAACAMEPHATLRPGWRAELVILGAPARALAGLSVLPSFEPASADASSLVWSSDASRIAEELVAGAQAHDGISVLIVGGPGSGKTTWATDVASRLDRPLAAVAPSSLLDPRRDPAGNAKVIRRACAEGGLALLLEPAESFLPRGVDPLGVSESWSELVTAPPGVVFLASRQPEALDPRVAARADVVVRLEPPRWAERKALWAAALRGGAPGTCGGEHVDPDRLARRYDLGPGAVHRAVAAALRVMRARGASTLSADDVDRGADLQVRHGLQSVAHELGTRLLLSDLVVSEEIDASVRSILDAARVREEVFDGWGFGRKQPRGRGLSILFDGEPGTGKTLCAEVLAAELAMPLFRVDMASVMSKWVGETEKNLRGIFDQARGSRCVLLFDEADALFGQRVEVKQAQDRFANLEINVLLQLMESHDGICVLTTNLKQGIDKAFERRLTFRVHFPFPDVVIRARLWAHLLPDEAPVAGDVDADLLASCFELSGGSIRNAIVKAAYRAASRGTAIEMDDLLEGAKAECVAAGRLYRIPVDD